MAVGAVDVLSVVRNHVCCECGWLCLYSLTSWICLVLLGIVDVVEVVAVVTDV